MTGNVPAGVTVLRVSELNQAAALVLTEAIGTVWVRGEISNWKPATSGHIYFALKEGAASRIDAVIWRSQAIRLRAGVAFRDGLEVIARGNLAIYAPQGRYQFVAERIEPVGLGSAEEALRLLREKLLQRGYFAPERKRALPTFPRRIAILTSATGAAIRDMLETIVRRWRLVDVVVCPVRVQGDGAALELIAALDRVNRLRSAGVLEIDVVIVGRGGGSAEDLGAFNDEGLAEAIFRSRIPVVSAVGHETDSTIADQVADYRAMTPTAAAEASVPDFRVIEKRLMEIQDRIGDALRRQAIVARQRLAGLASRRAFRLPLERVRESERRLDEFDQRLATAGQRLLDRRRDSLVAIAGRLKALSPLNVLTRGYSLTQTAAGDVLRDAAVLRVGDTITTKLSRGSVSSIVTATELPADD